MKIPSGQIRQSQILTTFWSGAMVDLPNYPIIIGGLNHWRGDGSRIHEERLEERVAEILGMGRVSLYAPLIDEQNPSGPRTGITAFTFPTWFLAQDDSTWKAPNGKEYRTRPLIRWGSLVKGKYLNAEKKKSLLFRYASCKLAPTDISATSIGMLLPTTIWTLHAEGNCGSMKAVLAMILLKSSSRAKLAKPVAPFLMPLSRILKCSAGAWESALGSARLQKNLAFLEMAIARCIIDC
jgi:hypothetical protein